MFKLKNRYLSGLVQWLALQQLNGKESRERTRFINVCQERLKEISGFYQGLMEKYIKKGKDGKYETRINESGEQVFKFRTKKEEDEYVKEITDLNEEEFKLELTEINKEMLGIIKKIVLETDYKFGPKENDSLDNKVRDMRIAVEYNEWAESLEALDR